MSFKNQTKKLDKILKALEVRETNPKLAEVNLDPIQQKADSNDNETAPDITEVEAVETSTVVLPSVHVETLSTLSPKLVKTSLRKILIL